MRILAVDPGEKRIGIAISDPSATLASPLTVIKHASRRADAEQIAALAIERECVRIIVGQALHWDGTQSESSRRAANLAAALQEICEIPIVLWDESGSTQAARQAAIELGVSRKQRAGHLDASAAAVILQSYLDSIPRSDA